MRRRLSRENLYHHVRPRSFGRFAIVGGANTIIGIGSFPVFYLLFGERFDVTTLQVMSWVVSTVFAFLLHKIVTFKSSGAYHKEGVKFLALALATLGINILIMKTVTHFFEANPVLIQFATSVGFAITFTILNYFGMDKLIFRKSKS